MNRFNATAKVAAATIVAVAVTATGTVGAAPRQAAADTVAVGASGPLTDWPFYGYK
jgi:hypothetical protein